MQALSRAAYLAAGAAVSVDPVEDADDEAPRRRWAVTPRAAVAVGVLVLLLVAGVLVRGVLVRAAPEPVLVPETRRAAEVAAGPRTTASASGAEDVDVGASEGSAGATTPSPSASSALRVVVHVAGQVHAPGIVELAAGARVHEAVAAAGGATDTADLAAINLARPVVDGEQVYVPGAGESLPPAASGAGSGGTGQAAVPGPVDLNRSTLADLDVLPGIGPVLAQRIVDWREQHGRFTVVDELGEVAGIGPTLLERLRPLVAV